MSVFDSLYDESGSVPAGAPRDGAPEGHAGEADSSPVRTLEGTPPVGDASTAPESPEASMGDAAAEAAEEAADEAADGAGDVPAGAGDDDEVAPPPAKTLEVDDDADGADLQDYAAALFSGASARPEAGTSDAGDDGAPDGAEAEHAGPADVSPVEPAAAAPPPIPATPPVPAAPPAPAAPAAAPAESSPAQAFGVLSTQAAPEASEAPAANESTESGEGGSPAAGALATDLLPSRAPSGGRSPELPSLGGSDKLRKVGLIVLCLLVGFVAYRFVAGGSDSSGDAAPVPPPAGEVDGSAGPAGAAGAANLAAAEVELRQAAVEAEILFSETGSYALGAEQWGGRLGQPVRAAGAAPEAGTLQVVSDGDAVCFETLVGTTTAAMGLTTSHGVAFTTAESGASVCTADAAVISGWQPTLTGA